MMILTALRKYEKSEIAEEIEVEWCDFFTSLFIIKTILHHLDSNFENLIDENLSPKFKSERARYFFNNLPDNFNKEEAINIGTRLEIPKSTISNIITKLIKDRLISREKHGNYSKLKVNS